MARRAILVGRQLGESRPHPSVEATVARERTQRHRHDRLELVEITGSKGPCRGGGGQIDGSGNREDRHERREVWRVLYEHNTYHPGGEGRDDGSRKTVANKVTDRNMGDAAGHENEKWN